MPPSIEKLEPSFREKMWGSTQLAPWFPNSKDKIGEVWFSTEEIPLLVKFLFTTDRLSVQVHPDDDYARTHEASLGKTEMWHVLRADPGARVALGFRDTITPDRMRESALSGDIEGLLQWIDVSPGDTIFTPPGTVHAIGGGLALCEVQQNSDLTYRLYDYGRPRELHLEKAMDVAACGPHPGKHSRQENVLVSCSHFHTELLELDGAFTLQPGTDRAELLIVLSGSGQVQGKEFAAGDVWRIPYGSEAFSIRGKAQLMRAFVPPDAAASNRA